jgi:hypothetical protein
MRTWTILVFILAGCGQRLDLCAGDKAKVQSMWGSPPDRVEDDSWTYVEEMVGKYTYTFVEQDGRCAVKVRGSFFEEDPFNPEI